MWNRVVKSSWCLVVVLSVCGCIPCGWVTPPIKAEAGIGFAPEQESGTGFPLRAGINPLQAFPALGQRNYDFGVGYQVWFEEEVDKQGLFLEASYLQPYDQWRLFATGKVHFLNRAGAWGVGGGGQVGAELLDYAEGPFDSCDDISEPCGIGYGLGEFAVGAYVEGSRIVFADDTLTFVGIGVQARIPASAGVAFLPLWNL